MGSGRTFKHQLILAMSKIKLDQISTRAGKDFDKVETKEKTLKIIEDLKELQNLLFAEHKHSILIIIQGMDASGKDGAITNVFGELNSQGVEVKSFKAPSVLELDHDFLWRVHKCVPPKGMIMVFNRSHYEDILITRVHNLIDEITAKKRIKAINDFEQLLTNHGNTQILKFYLHISPEKQHERLEERLKNPAKMWKYNDNDFKEAELWDRYMEMYEDAFEKCNDIPWIIVPSDQNWYKEYILASSLKKVLSGLDMKYPGLKK